MFSSLKAAAKSFIARYIGTNARTYPDAASQKCLSALYRSSSHAGVKTAISETGFKAYSQTDEDGILLYLLSIIGFENRRCVEICAGDGQECNTANLIINHGFHGLLVDGNQASVDKGKAFYAAHPSTYVFPPIFVREWVTKTNVNTLIGSNDFRGEIDILSLDLDGVDYWIWEAITVINPRIVVLEYQDILGPDLSVTVPYDDNFSGFSAHATAGMPNFSGASLRAFVKLAHRKGYKLVATNTVGFNAFFIRRDIPENVVPEIQIESCFGHPKVVEGIKTRFPIIKDLPWVEV